MLMLKSKLLNIYGHTCKYVEFTIPKGAKYYIGRLGDIVSTSIRSGSLKSIDSCFKTVL